MSVLQCDVFSVECCMNELNLITIHDWRASTNHYDLKLCQRCYNNFQNLFDSFISDEIISVTCKTR